MARLLQSGWMIMLLGTLLYLGTSVVLLDARHIGKLPGRGETQVLAARTTGPSWDYSDPEVDRLVQELNQEKLALAQQHEQLAQLAKRLEVERAELIAVTQTVHQLRAEIDRTYLRVQGEESKNLRRLAKMFATMPPETAVTIMNQLGEQEMAKLLALMKDDQVTAIIEFIAGQGEEQAKRAATLTQQMRQAIIDDAQP